MRLAHHGTKPGTAIQCKTKGSSCHRQSFVRVLSVIRAAQSSVFCVFFFRPLFIIFFLFRLAIALHSDNSFGIYKKTFGFLFRSEFFFPTTQELEYYFFCRAKRIFFPEFNIRLYDKNSESHYFFFLHQNQNIFFSNIGNQNIFLEKKP